MDLIKTLFPCIPNPRKPHHQAHLPEKKPLLARQSQTYPSYPSEKKQPTLSIQEASDQIASVLFHSTAEDIPLQRQVNSIIHQAGGWTESLAEAILTTFTRTLSDALSEAIAPASALPPLIHDALAKVIDAGKQTAELAEWFVEEHPVWTGVILTLVALGVLWLLWPWILGALGFGEEGIIEASWAARWQSSIGNVKKRSLFSFFQRLGARIGTKG